MKILSSADAFSFLVCTNFHLHWLGMFDCVLLDIVQSFPLLSYCIVSHIYISTICNVGTSIFFLWK